MKKLYLGYFNYFATGEPFELYIGTFLCDESEDPKWIFYNKVMNYNKDVWNFKTFKSHYEYYSGYLGTFLLKEYNAFEEYNAKDDVTICHVDLAFKEIKEKTNETIFDKNILDSIEPLLNSGAMGDDDFFLKVKFHNG